MGFAENARQMCPADVRMISGCKDCQTSADVSNVASFCLPDPAGRSGGACTAALLKILYAEKHCPTNDLTFVEVLTGMRDVLDDKEFTQIPQLTSSRKIDLDTPFCIAPEGSTGTRRAVMIGINYPGSNAELSGCHNDVLNMKEYIMDVHGFDEDNITVLMDDGEHKEPTRSNILASYKQLVEDSEDGDVVFCHYSGHGGKLRDDNNDEEDGYDETLIPCDYASNGQIRDDAIFDTLVQPMPGGVTMTCLMDCCHSGTVMDLPYKYSAQSDTTEMQEDEDFNFEKFFTFMKKAFGFFQRNF